MKPADVGLRTAWVQAEEEKLVVHIGTLTIVVEKNAEDGPLAYGDGKNHGITMWEQEYQKSDGEGITFGGGSLLAHTEMMESESEEIRDRLLDPSILDDYDGGGS